MKASSSSEPTCLHELGLGLALFMGQSLCKRNKNPHRKKKKSGGGGLCSQPCTHPISVLFCWTEATEQQWIWRMANIHSRYPERPHWGTPQSSTASHRKEQLLTRNSRVSGRGGAGGGGGGEQEDLPWIYYSHINLLGLEVPETSQQSKENNKQCEWSE